MQSAGRSEHPTSIRGYSSRPTARSLTRSLREHRGNRIQSPMTQSCREFRPLFWTQWFPCCTSRACWSPRERCPLKMPPRMCRMPSISWAMHQNKCRLSGGNASSHFQVAVVDHTDSLLGRDLFYISKNSVGQKRDKVTKGDSEGNSRWKISTLP